MYLSKYDQDGNYKWALNAGAGCNATLGIEIAIDANLDVLLGGSFCSTVDFDPSTCAIKSLSAVNSTSDSFTAKYSQDAANPTNPQITAFTLPQQVGATVIDKDNAKITIIVPAGTNLTNLTPTITATSNTSISPASGASGNFTAPVNYIITNSCQHITYTVVVDVGTTATPITNVTACPGNVTLFTGDVVTDPSSVFNWQISQNGVWVNAAGQSSQKNYTTTAPANTTGANIIYSYRRSVTAQAVTFFDSYFDLTVSTMTTNNAIAANLNVICAGDLTGVVITGNMPNGATNATVYSWEVSVDNISWHVETNANQQSFTYTQPVTGVIFFRRLSTTGTCLAYSNVVQVSASTTVTVANAGLPVMVCNQAQVTLNANTPAIGEIGTWTVVSPASYTPFTVANQNNPNAVIDNVPLDVTVQLKWTIVKAACGQQSESVVNINNNSSSTGSITTFSISNQTSPAVIDQANHKITVTMPPGTNLTALSPNFTLSPGSTSVIATGSVRNLSNPINYTVNGTCGSVTYQVTVNVIVPSVSSICPGFSVRIVGTPMPGVTIWQIEQNGVWVNAPGTYDAVDLATAAFTNTTGALMVYHIRRRLTQADGSVIYDTYNDLVILPSTDQNIISATNPAVCFGEPSPIVFTGTQPIGYIAGATYRWEQSTDDATWQVIPGATQQNYTHTAAVTQKMFIRRYTGVNACGALSNAIAIEYNGPVTTAVAGQPQAACSAAQFTLDANTVGTGETGRWSVVSPANYNPFTTSNINNPKAVINNIPADVDVQLKWTIKKNNCSQFSESMVTIRNNKAPVITAGPDLSIDPGNSIILQGNIASGGTYTYEWSPSAGLNNASVLNPAANPAETTVYTLTATNDDGGCTALDQVTVYVNNDLKYANTFTPNGDGFNDLWNIKNVETYKKLSVSIMNRWGTQIFYSNSYAKPWDGTYKGKKVPAGVYYFVIDIGDTNTKKSGSITVIY